MYVRIYVDGSVYEGKPSGEMTAAQAAEKTYELLRNDEHPAMLIHLKRGGILVLGPEVIDKAHIAYYDEEE